MHNNNRLLVIAVGAFLCFAALACNVPGGGTPESGTAPTDQPTLTATPAEETTDEPIPTEDGAAPTATEVPASATPTIAPTPTPEEGRITFEVGAASVKIEGDIAANGIDEYLLFALEGQTMTVTIRSSNSSVYVAVTGLADGNPLVRSAAEQTSWTGTLPASQDYSIKAVSTGEEASYVMTITIPPIDLASPALTVDMLRNASYELISGESVALVDGQFEREDPISPVRSHMIDLIAFGDLDVDGDYDAAVIIVTNNGGTGHFYNLYIVMNENGQPVNTASTFLGDRIIVNSIRIQGNEIIMDLIVQDDDDPFCCPSLATTVRFALENGELVYIEG